MNDLCNIKKNVCNYITFFGTSKRLKFVYHLESTYDKSIADRTGSAIREGFSVMLFCEEGNFWLPHDQFVVRSSTKEFVIELENYVTDWKKGYYLLVYLPVFSELLDFEIGIDVGTKLEIVDTHQEGILGYIGEENTKGIGVTMSTMSFYNIIARKSDYRVKNLAYEFERFEDQFLHVDQLVECNQIVVELNSIVSVELLMRNFDFLRMKLQSYSGNIIFWTSVLCTDLSKKIDALLEHINVVKNVNYIVLNKEEFFINECMFSPMGPLNDYGNIILAGKIMKIISGGDEYVFEYRSSN